MKENKKQRLFEIASLQQGYFTAKQAVYAGFSYRMQAHYKQNGEWLDAGWGVFRLAQFPHSPDEDYVRCSLWSRNRLDQVQAVISHDSALLIHGLGDVMPAKIHLTVPPGFRKTPPKGCGVHKGRVGNKEKEEREGFYVTSPLRTIIDSAANDLSLDYLERAVQDAFDKGLFRIIDIVSADMSNKAQKKIMTVLKNIKNRQEGRNV